MTSLTTPGNYAYPNVRVMAMKGFLLKESDIKALLSAKDLESYAALLEHTPYRENFSRLEGIGIDAVENAIFAHLADTNKKMLDMVPAKAAKFLEGYSEKYEIELLKIIINDFGRTNKDYSSYYPLLGKDVKRIIAQIVESKNLSDVIELLRKTKYRRYIDEIPASGDQRLSLITALDRHYFENLWEIVEDLSGTEIDMINIMTILRSIKGNYDAEKFLIPVSYRLDDLKGISGLNNIADVVSKLSTGAYGEVLEKSLQGYEETKSLLPLELNFRAYLIRLGRDLFMGYPFHIGVPLGFIIIKEAEIENLRAIAIGIDSGLPSKEIEGMIVWS